MGLASTQDPRDRGSSLLRAAATTLAAVLVAGNQNLVNLRGDVEEGVADAEELGGHPQVSEAADFSMQLTRVCLLVVIGGS